LCFLIHAVLQWFYLWPRPALIYIREDNANLGIGRVIKMIDDLKIRNFKSIRHLKLNCGKINLFIGEPNAGKSNILESLALLSFLKYGRIEDFVRIEGMSNLFHDENLDENLEIKANDHGLVVAFKDGRFLGRQTGSNGKECSSFDYDYDAKGTSSVSKELLPIKLYRFSPKKDFQQKDADFLRPPSGNNLFSVLRNHKGLREAASAIFEPFQLKLVFRLQENKIEIMKQQDDAIITYPYFLTSDTLQRIVFYSTAIDSNKDSILVFEEPESHSFPYYTKYLGEKIAFDLSNQYFIATHNPYLLLAILEKAKRESVCVFITYFKDHQTKVKSLNADQISELMSYDPFFNLEGFIGDEEQ